jgi:hypothetical protein
MPMEQTRRRIDVYYVALPVNFRPVAKPPCETSSDEYSIASAKTQIGDSTASPYSWALIQRWLAQCRHFHSAYNSTVDSSWVLTRLLDIGASNGASNVRLQIMPPSYASAASRYVTLSHRWGLARSLQVKLTQGNLAALCNGIALAELLPTFKDAIQATRRLGLQYLWIDSLCIIQDDAENWARESAVIGKVYMNSMLNISATGSDNSSQGCIFQRDPSRVVLFPTRRLDPHSASQTFWAVI